MWACELIYVVSILSPDEEYTRDVHGRWYSVEPECMPSPTRLVWAGRVGIEGVAIGKQYSDRCCLLRPTGVSGGLGTYGAAIGLEFIIVTRLNLS